MKLSPFERTPSAPLDAKTGRWLAAFLLCAQGPHWFHLPPWVAGAGSLLIAFHFAVDGERRLSRWLLPLLASVAAVGIYATYGYFLARDPCVAFLYVLVGVKFIEARSVRDGALLACLGLFLSLTGFFYGQAMLNALAAAPALLLLGAVLAALRRAPPAAARWYAPLLRTGAMIVHGMPLAALLFLLFPRLAAPLWGIPADSSARTGLSDRMAPGMISSLSQSDAVAFRVDFRSAAPPSSAQRYWRGPVLSVYDGREWTAPPLLIQRARLLRPAAGRAVSYVVTLEPNDRPWLFALELASTLPRPADEADAPPRMGSELALMTQDRQLLARGPVVQAVRYEQSSVLRDSFPAGANEHDSNLALPDAEPLTKAFARELRAKVGSDAEFASELLRWFHNEAFVYTLNPPLLDRNPVDAFLFGTRRGFCEHYASAFVVLLRAAGIPARAVTGYQGGEINPNGDYMIVRQSDAHAWTEAMIGGQWVRYDPTAAVAPSRIESGLGAAVPAGEPVPFLARLEFTWLKSARLHWDAVNYQWQRGIVGFNTSRQREFLRDLGLDANRPWQAVALIALGALSWGLVVLGMARVRRKHEDPAAVLWQQFCARLAKAGLARRPAEGPLAFADRAAARWPHIAATLRDIAADYAKLRYGADDVPRDLVVARLKETLRSLPAARALGMNRGAI